MSALLESRDARARALMEDVLRDGASLEPEYPLVFGEAFAGRIVGLGEGDDVHSACGILTRDFLVSGTTVRGGLIGSVATGEAWRRHGLATHVLVAAEAALELDGCAFALLWTQSPSFYLKRGYGPIGSELNFVVPFELCSKLPSTRAVRDMQPEDAPAIHALYAQHTVRVDRSAGETEALLACPGMCTLVYEHDGTVVGYACMGRGADLVDVIHEWGGRTTDVLALLRAHLERRFGGEASKDGDARALVVMAPSSSEELVHRLTDLGVVANRGMLGLGKILDREAAARVLSARLGPSGTVEIDAQESDRRFLVSGPKKSGHLDDEGALALLLGIEEVRDDVAAFLEEFGLEGADLPIEAFAWGLDSI